MAVWIGTIQNYELIPTLSTRPPVTNCQNFKVLASKNPISYSRLYPDGPIFCPLCSLHPDTNDHVSYCSSHFNNIVTLLVKFRPILIHIIETNASGPISDLSIFINNLEVFSLLSSSVQSTPFSLPQNHPISLLIHNIIPLNLSSVFHKYIGHRNIRHEAFLSFIFPFITELNCITWGSRASSLKNGNRQIILHAGKRLIITDYTISIIMWRLPELV